jgi:predicted molibdopterin-dependent oxidoreductase YjgC
MRKLGIERRAMVVRRGKFDDFLIKAEKAANARGARELGLVAGEDDGLTELLGACETGEIKGLYLCGDDWLEAEVGRLAAVVPQMELIVSHNLTLWPQLKGATVVFPTTTFAEKDGTFTNHAGRVQRIRKALQAPAGWLTDGEVFTAMLNHLEVRQERFELTPIWEAMAQNHTPFAQLKFDHVDPDGVLLAGC